MARPGLTWKLVALNVGLIALVLAIVYLSIEHLAAGYFSALMSEYGIDPSETHHMFLQAVHRALVWAALVSVVGAVAACYLLTRRILGPLSQMLQHTRQVARGDYHPRIEVGSRDEVGQLAAAFNDMARSLERIESLRQRMVVDVAHELRTPLSSIQGYLEALRDGVIEASPETLAMVHEETVTLARLVEDLLQLARAEASALHLDSRPVALQPLLADLLGHYAERLADRVVEVRVDAGCTVRADPAKLHRILRNLLDNAEQHTRAGGRIVIEASREAALTRVSVGNTGETVAPEHLAHIFERFYRVDAARSRERGGAGIGLAIVKELVAAHGGEVGAEPGAGGMRVWFTLPGSVEAARAGTRESGVGRPGSAAA